MIGARPGGARWSDGAAFNGHLHRFRPAAEPVTDTVPFPAKLSDTGLFESTTRLEPNPGLVPCDVNVPLWSDNAAKERFLALPNGGKVRFNEEGHWDFPVGAVFVKSFFLDLDEEDAAGRKRLETRLLVHSPRGWEGYTYLWADDESDAFLLDGAARKPYRVATGGGIRDEERYFPSRADCMACYTQPAGFVLGMRTRQMNRPREGKNETQIRFLDRLGVFAAAPPVPPGQLPAHPDWEAGSGTNGERARAYLDANCVMCHIPPGFTQIDLRIATPLVEMSLVGRNPEKPRLGPPPAPCSPPRAIRRFRNCSCAWPIEAPARCRISRPRFPMQKPCV